MQFSISIDARRRWHSCCSHNQQPSGFRWHIVAMAAEPAYPKIQAVTA
jgi:hypothetical protein